MMIEMNSDLFCIRLKEIRKMRKMTQQELSEKSGIPSTSIAHIEAGSRKPSLENFYKLVVVLNVSADYLFFMVRGDISPVVHGESHEDDDQCVW